MADKYDRELFGILEHIETTARRLAEKNSEHPYLDLAHRLTHNDDFLFGHVDEATIEMLEKHRGEEETVCEVLLVFLSEMEDVLRLGPFFLDDDEDEEDAVEATGGKLLPAMA